MADEQLPQRRGSFGKGPAWEDPKNCLGLGDVKGSLRELSGIQSMGQKFGLHSESGLGPHEGVEQKNDIFRSLWLVCWEGPLERSEQKQDHWQGWGERPGPVVLLLSPVTARFWGQRATHSACDPPVPAQQPRAGPGP